MLSILSIVNQLFISGCLFSLRPCGPPRLYSCLTFVAAATGLLFACAKRSKSTFKGPLPLENPLNVSMCFALVQWSVRSEPNRLPCVKRSAYPRTYSADPTVSDRGSPEQRPGSPGVYNGRVCVNILKQTLRPSNGTVARFRPDGPQDKRKNKPEHKGESLKGPWSL